MSWVRFSRNVRAPTVVLLRSSCRPRSVLFSRPINRLRTSTCSLPPLLMSFQRHEMGLRPALGKHVSSVTSSWASNLSYHAIFSARALVFSQECRSCHFCLCSLPRNRFGMRCIRRTRHILPVPHTMSSSQPPSFSERLPLFVDRISTSSPSVLLEDPPMTADCGGQTASCRARFVVLFSAVHSACQPPALVWRTLLDLPRFPRVVSRMQGRYPSDWFSALGTPVCGCPISKHPLQPNVAPNSDPSSS